MQLTGKIAETKPETLKTVSPANTTRTWVMVADRRKARFFSKTDRSLDFQGEAVAEEEGREPLTNKSIGNVVASSGGALHHQYAPHMGASRHDELLFVRELSEWLEEAVKANCFDRLVLVAPPQMLGYLRQGLSKHVLDRVTADVNKDLMRMNGKALREELSRLIVF